jgi:AcrR family transcriptional regulator
VPNTTSNASSLPIPTRERIKLAAESLYVLHGHDGFSFADIAEVIGTTRANIHHHFGSKQKLMAELVGDFALDAQRRIECHWTKSDLRFSGRLKLQLDDLRRFYLRFNPAPGDRKVWSPVSRLRLDLPALGEPAVQALEQVNRAYVASLQRALGEAVGAEELSADTPIEDVAQMLRMTFLSCPPMTQDSGDFAEIERLFHSVENIIFGAWGVSLGRSSPP